MPEQMSCKGNKDGRKQAILDVPMRKLSAMYKLLPQQSCTGITSLSDSGNAGVFHDLRQVD
jgi:hypothetical protein